jgi:MFS family permease
MGVKRSTCAVSPASAACMMRLNNRSNRSRGLSWLMSGAGPAGGVVSPAAAPALAMLGTWGAGDSVTTLYTIAAISRTHIVPAKIQAVRSEPGARPPAPPGWPQRWQNLAWAPRGARQRVQLLGVRLAPQALQNFPEAAAPQAGHRPASGGAVIGEEAYTG